MSRRDRAQLLEDGPWSGLVDSGVHQPGELRQADNVYPLNVNTGEPYIGRPGFKQLGATLTGRVQGFARFKSINLGVAGSVVVSGGRLYARATGATGWTEQFTTANLTTAGITLNDGTDTRAYHVSFLTVYVSGGARLMVSDGINTPFLWTGATGVGSLIAMPNVPVLYGPMTLYEGRVFGIKATDRLTMVWGEADNPLIGYDIAGGYGNAWSFRQTDNRDLTVLVGTNAGLVIFRERSASSAYGTVDSTFSSLSTKEGISTSVGTSHPWSVTAVGTSLLFLDADCRAHEYRQGGQGFIPLWSDLQVRTEEAAGNTNFTEAMGVYYPPLESVLFFTGKASTGTTITSAMMYSVRGGTTTAVATWGGMGPIGSAGITAVGLITTFNNGNNTPVLVIGDSLGAVYELSSTNANYSPVWNDVWAGGTVAIAHKIETGELGYSTNREKIFDRVDIACESATAMALSISLTAPDAAAPAQSISTTVLAEDSHVAVGTDARGRWVRALISHSALGERFGVTALTVTAVVQSDDPPVK